MLAEPAERALALALLGFGDVVAHVGDQLEPHRLCGYLFDLAQAFSPSTSTARCSKPTPTVRGRGCRCAPSPSRHRPGLDLLGLEAPERM